MTRIATAIYEDGVFKPEGAVSLAPGARVEVVLAEEESFEELRARLRRKFPNSLGSMSREQGEEILRAIDERSSSPPSP